MNLNTKALEEQSHDLLAPRRRVCSYLPPYDAATPPYVYFQSGFALLRPLPVRPFDIQPTASSQERAAVGTRPGTNCTPHATAALEVLLVAIEDPDEFGAGMVGVEGNGADPGNDSTAESLGTLVV